MKRKPKKKKPTYRALQTEMRLTLIKLADSEIERFKLEIKLLENLKEALVKAKN